jgi:hypothetical protein
MHDIELIHIKTLQNQPEPHLKGQTHDKKCDIIKVY